MTIQVVSAKASIYKSSIKIPTRYIQAPFSIKTPDYKTYQLQNLCYPLFGKKNIIVRIADQLNGLTAIKATTGKNEPLRIAFKESVKLLIAAETIPNNTIAAFDNKNPDLVIDSALSIAGMMPIRVFTVNYNKGLHVIDSKYLSSYFIIGVLKSDQPLQTYNAKLPDGRLWRSFQLDGYPDKKPLFDILGGPETPVIDSGMAGTEEIQGGFEGGTCVKVKDTYHLFPTERAGQAGVGAYFDRVKTHIGHWISTDAIHWKRLAPIFTSSGTYALKEEDNPMNDRRAAIWSYNAIFDKEKDRWLGFYLTYTVDKKIAPNHSFGRIWCTESQTTGFTGIDGPYAEGHIIMEPGLDSQLWEGRQGVASFYPFPVANGWLGFYAGAFPFLRKDDYPRNGKKGWDIGLASAISLEGPWTRLDSTVNPVKSINPDFVENPIVYQINGGYIALFDGGPDAGVHRYPNMIGYTVSRDGLHWSEAHYLPVQTKLKVWWNTMRTPLCLIPEGNDIYTILFAAIPSKRFHPIGMFRVKLNNDVFNQLLKEN